MSNELVVLDGLLLDVECENTKGEKVYPSQKKGNGKFSVSVTGASTDYFDVSMDDLIGLFAHGVFDRGAQLRMSPKNRRSRNGQAPNKGSISEAFRKIVQAKREALKAPESIFPASQQSSGSNSSIAPRAPGDKQHDLAIAAHAKATLESDTPNLTTAEREAVVKVRFGQGSFREALFRNYAAYGEKCWMSGIEGKRLLIASHIKPWSHCADNTEARGQPDNGLVLSSLWDAAFDAGLVSFDADWKVVVSPDLSESAGAALNYKEHSTLPEMFRTEGRKKYVAYHYANVFEYWKAKVVP